MENNENKTICSLCAGKCCKNMGCHLAPEDVNEISVKEILSLINTENYSIDYWEGDVFNKKRGVTYYLRMRNLNSPIIDPSWGGKPCAMFSISTGCKLNWENRPMGGKGLIPKKDEKSPCRTIYSKEQCCKDWYKYQDIFDEVIAILDGDED